MSLYQGNYFIGGGEGKLKHILYKGNNFVMFYKHNQSIWTSRTVAVDAVISVSIV